MRPIQRLGPVDIDGETMPFIELVAVEGLKDEAAMREQIPFDGFLPVTNVQ